MINLRIAVFAGAVAIVILVTWLVYHKGEKAGGDKVAAQAERQHAQAVAEARVDERTAQAASDRIGTAVATTNAESTRTLETIIEGMKHDLSTAKAARNDFAGADVPVPDSVRNASNAGVDSANRAADAAEAAARAAAR